MRLQLTTMFSGTVQHIPESTASRPLLVRTQIAVRSVEGGEEVEEVIEFEFPRASCPPHQARVQLWWGEHDPDFDARAWVKGAVPGFRRMVFIGVPSTSKHRISHGGLQMTLPSFAPTPATDRTVFATHIEYELSGGVADASTRVTAAGGLRRSLSPSQVNLGF